MKPLDDLTLYAYGLLDERAEEAIEDHVRRCPDCAGIVRRLETEHAFFVAAFAREKKDIVIPQ